LINHRAITFLRPFSELSRQYLKEWGELATQRRSAGLHGLLPTELFPRNRRVVILSQVLPANSTIGYDDLAYFHGEKGTERNQIIDDSGEAEATRRGFIKIETEEDPKQTSRRVASRR
jgi:hypothetical protein